MSDVIKVKVTRTWLEADDGRVLAVPVHARLHYGERVVDVREVDVAVLTQPNKVRRLGHEVK